MSESGHGDSDGLAERLSALETQHAETCRALEDALRRLAMLEAATGAASSDGYRHAESERFSAIYPAFEDRFRGSEAEITETPVRLPTSGATGGYVGWCGGCWAWSRRMAHAAPGSRHFGVRGRDAPTLRGRLPRERADGCPWRRRNSSP